MFIETVELKNYRNYAELQFRPDPGINVLYGDNAQGKTNLLESIYVGCTSKSHRSAKDRELIRFQCEEAHIKITLRKKELSYRIDLHIKKNQPKGIALNGVPIRRVSELFGIANVVIFSPEDLGIIKNGPSERRRFLDLELCQLDPLYVHHLISYNRVLNQRNTLLKEMSEQTGFSGMLEVYNQQLKEYGSLLIQKREEFIGSLNQQIQNIHKNITNGSEEIKVIYEKNVETDAFETALSRVREQELRQRVSLVGPHRDDFLVEINGIDMRHYGSQGQQRTAALSLKLAEINLVRDLSDDNPVLLLDDVLSELDQKRQSLLLQYVKGLQTVITCTGLDEFIQHQFQADRIFRIVNGSVTGETECQKNLTTK